MADGGRDDGVSTQILRRTNTWLSDFRITDDAGLVDFFVGKADIGRRGRCWIQTFWLRTFAYGSDLATLLRGVVFVCDAALRNVRRGGPLVPSGRTWRPLAAARHGRPTPFSLVGRVHPRPAIC